jgi:membrane protease YdiL (CAAX protease family)
MTGTDIYAPRAENHRRTWTIAVMAMVLLFLIIGSLAAVLAWNLSGLGQPITFDPKIDLPNASPLREAFGIGAGFGLALIPLFLWIWFFERGRLSSIGLRDNPVMPFVAGILGGMASITIVVSIIALLGGFRIEGTGMWTTPTPAALLPFAFFGIAFLIQGSTEEILIRGWLMQIAASRYGVTIAIILSSMYFSILHGGNIEPKVELAFALANIVLVGIFLAVVCINLGNLWVACGWHASWNWLMSTGFGLEVSGIDLKTGALVLDLAKVDSAPWWITGGIFGPEASAVTTAFLLAACAWALLQPKRED